MYTSMCTRILYVYACMYALYMYALYIYAQYVYVYGGMISHTQVHEHAPGHYFTVRGRVHR